MSLKQILALSSSRAGNEAYLETAAFLIKDFLGDYSLKIAFIPFALVSKNYDEYSASVSLALSALPYAVYPVNYDNAKDIIQQCDVIMVGGGNTFKLLHDIYEAGILQLIRDKINAGLPYIGWSAGSNIVSPTICTTNDMPVIEPQSFKALGFFPFQINPHYYNQNTDGFNGETRDQRLFEFIEMNPAIKIIGLPEGTALQLHQKELKFIGRLPGILFHREKINNEPRTRQIAPGEDLSFLL